MHYPYTMRSAVESNTVQLSQFTVAPPANDGITQITVNPQKASNSSFFSAEGPSFGDVLDAINPLNHIPIVSDIYQDAVQHTPSVGAQLVGGTLFGGPIGFVASLANVIFEQQTGKGAMGTAYAALSGSGDATTQLASADSTGETQTASLDEDATQIAAPVTSVTTGDTPSATSSRDQTLLSLYGGSAASAQKSYQKAQLLPYLKDVNHNQVL